MKIVILGAGRRGTELASHLIEEKNDVVIVDSSKQAVDAALSKLDCLGITGNATDITVLRNAGCADSDVVIAVTESDEINLIACGMVKSSFPKVKTLATIRSLSYSGLKTGLLGIDYIVNPNNEASRNIRDIIQTGIFGGAYSFSNTSLLLFNYHIKKGSRLDGKSVMEARKALNVDFVIAAIERQHQGIVPEGSTLLQAGDTLSIVTDETNLDKLLQAAGNKQEKIHKIALVGATRLCETLLASFSKRERSGITLFESDSALCEEAASQFPEILVINADVTNEGTLEEEHVNAFDLLISLTDDDELNVITASYAKRIGVRHSVALVKNNNNYVRLARHLDLDIVVSTIQATVDSILQLLRGDNISSSHSLFGGKFEVSEFLMTKASKLTGKHLHEINMKQKGIVAGITTADGKSFIPNGDTLIKEGDRLLVTYNHYGTAFIQDLFVKAIQ